MKLYGIPNCNTVKKARAWLEERGLSYDFHDFRKFGVPEAMLMALMQERGWEALVNRSGPTWRKLPEERKARVVDAAAALEAMQENSSIIRRPILESGDHYLIGFKEAEYEEFFAK